MPPVNRRDWKDLECRIRSVAISIMGTTRKFINPYRGGDGTLRLLERPWRMVSSCARAKTTMRAIPHLPLCPGGGSCTLGVGALDITLLFREVGRVTVTHQHIFSSFAALVRTSKTTGEGMGAASLPPDTSCRWIPSFGEGGKRRGKDGAVST